MPKGIKMEKTGVFATTQQKAVLESLIMGRGNNEGLARVQAVVDGVVHIPNDPGHYIHLCAIGHGLPGLPGDGPLLRYELDDSGEFVLAAPVWRKRKENSEFRNQKSEEKTQKLNHETHETHEKEGKKRLGKVDRKKTETPLPTREKYKVRTKQEDLLVELCNRTEEVTKIRNEMLTIRTELEGIKFDYNKRKESLDECVRKYAESM